MENCAIFFPSMSGGMSSSVLSSILTSGPVVFLASSARWPIYLSFAIGIPSAAFYLFVVFLVVKHRKDEFQSTFFQLLIARAIPVRKMPKIHHKTGHLQFPESAQFLRLLFRSLRSDRSVRQRRFAVPGMGPGVFHVCQLLLLPCREHCNGTAIAEQTDLPALPVHLRKGIIPPILFQFFSFFFFPRDGSNGCRWRFCWFSSSQCR